MGLFNPAPVDALRRSHGVRVALQPLEHELRADLRRDRGLGDGEGILKAEFKNLIGQELVDAVLHRGLEFTGAEVAVLLLARLHDVAARHAPALGAAASTVKNFVWCRVPESSPVGRKLGLYLRPLYLLVTLRGLRKNSHLPARTPAICQPGLLRQPCSQRCSSRLPF